MQPGWNRSLTGPLAENKEENNTSVRVIIRLRVGISTCPGVLTRPALSDVINLSSSF